MFLHLSVILFTGGGVCGGGHVWQGVCMAGGHAWWGGACVARGSCVARRACMAGGGRAWQQRLPLQQTVRILLECILVLMKVSMTKQQKVYITCILYNLTHQGQTDKKSVFWGCLPNHKKSEWQWKNCTQIRDILSIFCQRPENKGGSYSYDWFVLVESEGDIASRWVHRESSSIFILSTDKDQRKQECILVECVPPACWPYPIVSRGCLPLVQVGVHPPVQTPPLA